MKRYLSLVLALTLVLSMLPVPSFAEEYLIEESPAEFTEPVEEPTEPAEEATEPVEEPSALAKPPKKNAGSKITAQGTCGNDLTWALDSEGVLRVSGAGDMENNFFASSNSYSELVNEVIIEDGVTSIGAHTFTSCSNLAT